MDKLERLIRQANELLQDDGVTEEDAQMLSRLIFNWKFQNAEAGRVQVLLVDNISLLALAWTAYKIGKLDHDTNT